MKLYGEWRVVLPDGEEHTWRPDDVTPGEELIILSESGCDDYEQWVAAIDRREAVPTQVLIWFLRRQQGQQCDRMAIVFPHRRLKTIRLTNSDGTPFVDEAAAGDGEGADGPPEDEAASSGSPEPAAST